MIVFGIVISLFTGNIKIVNEQILFSGKSTLDILIKMFYILSLWMGISKVAVKSGLLNKLSKLLQPLLRLLFPEIDKNNKSLDYISSNIIANMFGLGSAATPFGLQAMKELQQINPNKDTASKSMITFLILNTSGLTIIPTTVISMRLMHNSINPSSILPATIISTLISTVLSILIDKIFRRIK